MLGAHKEATQESCSASQNQQDFQNGHWGSRAGMLFLPFLRKFWGFNAGIKVAQEGPLYAEPALLTASYFTSLLQILQISCAGKKVDQCHL